MREAELPPPTQGAGFWIRAGARMLDTVLLMGLGALSGFGAAMALAVLSAMGVVDDNWVARLQAGGGVISSLGFSVLVSVTFHALCEALAGATPGKLAFGLRVVDEHGGRAPLGAVLIRSVAAYVDILFLGLVGWNAMQDSALRQRYGDQWAKTVVVSKDDVGLRARRTTGTTVLVVTIALVISSLLQMASILVKAW
jgi:uncharacterized RDD family membrane protein YckC